MNLDDTRAQVDAALAREDWAEVGRLAAILDAEDAAREKALGDLGGLVGAALWYASLGVPVFPLQPRDKRPLPGSHGFKDATTDADTIRAWWTRTPAANVGAATGHRFDVIDIDGIVGIRSCLDLDPGAETLAAMLEVDELGHATTPRGGGHHIYVTPDQRRGNRAGLLPGVDYRGLGGYVAMPPSVGSNGRRYRWTRPLRLEETT